jgi:hypothetical protein
MTDPTQKANYEALSQKYTQGAQQMGNTQKQFADKYLTCNQYGWGITPIIGIDYNIVWETIQKRLPELKEPLKRI